MRKAIMFFLVLVQYGCSSDFYYKDHKKIILKPVTEAESRSEEVRYYKTMEGIQVGITNKILVKLAKDISIEPYVKKYHLKHIRQLSASMYLVEVGSLDQTLDIANALDKEECIVYASPDFIKRRVLR